MTSSKIRGFQTSTVIFRHFCKTPSLDDLILNRPPFSHDDFGKIVFYGKIEKGQNQDLIDEYYSNKYQSNCC